MIFKHSARTAQ